MPLYLTPSHFQRQQCNTRGPYIGWPDSKVDKVIDNFFLDFFLLAAAWVDPGRSALQSRHYGRISQVSYNDAKRTIPGREKQQKHSKIKSKKMKRIDQTNSKTN